MRIIDMALVAGLFCVIGFIAGGLKYAVPKSCPQMNGNTHLAMEVKSDGSYRCVYHASVWGMAKRVIPH